MEAKASARTHALTVVVTLAVVSFAGGAGAAEVLSNPGFEAGVLSPWTTDGNWAIETTNCHSGSYCASNDGNNSIRQTFSAIPTSSITSVTFWMRQPSASIASYQFGYSDATTSGTVILPTSSWSQFDATSFLTSGKNLTSLTIWGYTAGGAGPYISVVDDVSIQSNIQASEAIPMLGRWGMLALALAVAVAGAILVRRFA